MEQLDELNKKQNKTWLSIGVTAVTTAIIVGGGVFWWQKNIINKFQKENVECQQELENQIQKLQEQIAKIEKIKQDSSEIDDDENWNLYQNEEYGFKFNYPSDWKDSNRDIENQNYYTKSPNISIINLNV